MPWTCESCGAEVALDTEHACPRCAAAKADWTLVAEKTREFKVSLAGLRALRGVVEETAPADDPSHAAPELVATDVAPALPRACAQRLAALGHLPPTRHTLWLRPPVKKGGAAPEVTLAVNFEGQEVEDVALETEPAGDGVQARVLLVFGPGELADDAFPGLRVIDVSELPGVGHAPGVEVAVRNKKPKLLPIEPGLCAECGWIAVRLLDASGTAPLAGELVTADLPDVGRVELVADEDGRVLHPGVPFADYDLQVGGADLVPAPAVPTAATLHQRHVPHARRAFARLQVRDAEGFPLDRDRVVLEGPDGASLELETDDDGLVQHEGALPVGEWTVRAAGAQARVVLPTTPRELAIARLA